MHLLRTRARRWIVGGVLVAAAVPAAAYGYLVWTTRDAPDRARLQPPASVASASASAEGTRTATSPPSSDGVDGEWVVVASDGGFVGYRIRERLGPLPAPSDAVGRSEDVTGSAVITSNRLTDLQIVVDMTTVRSDVDGRDDRLRTEALETATFPDARFALSQPVVLPTPQLGEVVALQIVGLLTLHGSTNAVTIDLQARWDGPSIQVAGSAAIQRADFDISVDGLPGFRIDSSGIFEFELALVPSDSTVQPTASTIVDNPATRTGITEDPPCTGQEAADIPAAVTFTVYGPTGAQVWIAEPGATPRVVFRQAASASWSPDGTRIVYATAPTTDIATELMVANADGTAPVPLGVRDASEPSWSPNRTLIAFSRPTPNGSAIWVVNADGTDAHHLIGDEQLDASQPRWTPDGAAIVFTALSQETNDDVMIAAADGTNIRPLAGTEAYEYSGSVVGDRLVYVIDGQVHRASLDGAEDQAITAGPTDGDAALTADGQVLAFVRLGNLYVGDLTPGADTCLVVGRTVGGDVRWKPVAP